MPWNNGVFSRYNGEFSGNTVWQNDRDASYEIEADRHDAHDQDLAQGINACLPRDGSAPLTGDLDMGGNRLSNLLPAQIADELVILGQTITEVTFEDGVLALRRDSMPDFTVDLAIDLAGAETSALEAAASAEKNAEIVLSSARPREYQTLDELLTVGTIEDGELVRISGRSAANDGGGNTYRVVPAGTGIADGGRYIDHPQSGVQLEGLFPGGTVHLRQFGVAGDGTTVDDDAFEAALSSGLKLTGENLHLRLLKTSGFTFSSDLNFKNVTLDFSGIGTNNFRKLLYSTGSQKSEQAVGDVPSGTTEIAYYLDVAVGDLVLIHNAEDCFNADPAEGVLRGELFEVQEIKPGNILRLDRAVLLDLNGATATVYSPTTASVRGVKFIGNGFDITENNETAIQIEFGKDNVIENCSTHKVEHYSINVDNCLRPRIRFNTLVHDQPDTDEAQDIQNAGKVVYAIAIFNGTSLMDCHDNIITGAKHQIDFTQHSGWPGYGVFNKVHNNILMSCWHASIAGHDTNTETEVSGNLIYDTMRGIEFRTPNNYAFDNVIHTRRLRGVSGGEGVYLTEDFSGSIIRGNRIDAKTRCIRCDAGITSSGVEIAGNALSNNNGATDAIRFDTAVVDSVIRDNYAVGDAFDTHSGLVRSLVQLERCVISGNWSKGGVVNVDMVDGIVEGNKRLGAGFAVSLTGSGNIVRDNTSLTGAPVSYVGGFQRGNFSAAPANASIRTSGVSEVIDVFDTYVKVDPDGHTELDRVYTGLVNGVFVLELLSGSVTVNHSTSTADSIRTLSGAPFTWSAGEALVLAKTSTGYFQLSAA